MSKITQNQTNSQSNIFATLGYWSELLNQVSVSDREQILTVATSVISGLVDAALQRNATQKANESNYITNFSEVRK